MRLAIFLMLRQFPMSIRLEELKTKGIYFNILYRISEPSSHRNACGCGCEWSEGAEQRMMNEVNHLDSNVGNTKGGGLFCFCSVGCRVRKSKAATARSLSDEQARTA
jgi:hypothetical protein